MSQNPSEIFQKNLKNKSFELQFLIPQFKVPELEFNSRMNEILK